MQDALLPAALCEWGLAGIAALRAEVRVFVIVDVLSFSTAVDVAVSRGAVVQPAVPGLIEDTAGAVLAAPRRATGSHYSLSPASLTTLPAGLRLILPSPNGARLSLACAPVPVLAGCLRNAGAVARAARRLAGTGAVGVIPAGERWPDGGLRPAIEDLLGAGAILHHLDLPCSAEAELARDAYRSAGTALARLIQTSVSGRELADAGFAADVALAVERDVSGVAPVLRDGVFADSVR